MIEDLVSKLFGAFYLVPITPVHVFSLGQNSQELTVHPLELAGSEGKETDEI